MKKIRKYFAVIMAVMALIAFILPAQADVSVIDVGCTNTVVANGTTTANMGNAVSVANQPQVDVVFQLQGNAAGTGNMVLTWLRSADGTIYETSPGITNSVAANGTTAVVGYFNIPTTQLGNAKFIKLYGIQNANASMGATNVSVQVVLKRIR